jgi:ubiquinol-cytochrome c reductase cytochrome b subunit
VITRWLVRRVDDRLRLSPAGRSGLLNRVFPDHWSFMVGEIATYAFGYLIVSGVFLTLFFDATDDKTVYDGSYGPMHGARLSSPFVSVLSLSWDVRFGLVVRQSHHWAALVFCSAIVVHLCRIFFTGAFRRPRELNWVLGVVLMVLAFADGFTGYDLPDDLLSGMGLNIVNAVLLAIPWFGPWLSFMLFGGEFPGHHVITRLYAIHVVILPAMIAGALALHLWMVARQRHGQFPGPGRTETNVVGPRLWPARAVRGFGLMSAVFGLCLLLGGLVQIDPIWMWGDFEAGRTMGPSQPDFYMGWIDGALRLLPGWEPTVFGWRMPSMFLPAIILPGLTFGVLLLWPWLERLVTGDGAPHHLLQRPRERPGRVAVGVWAMTFYPMLLFAWAIDVVSRYSGIPDFVLVNAFRYGVLFFPLLTGLVAFVLARALRDSEAEALLELTWSDLRGSLRRHRRVAEPPAPWESIEDEREIREQEPSPPEPGPEEFGTPEPVRVEAGPVP